MKYNQIIEWAHDRNLINPDFMKSQMLKVVSEVGELSEGIIGSWYKDDADWHKKCVDGIGDVLVTLIILSEQYNQNPDVEAIDMQHLFDRAYYEAESNHGLPREMLGLFVVIGNLSDVINKWQLGKVQELIGESIIKLVQTSKGLGLSLQGCLDHAYEEIKNRKGKTVGGTFIKE